jgi:hypothetical protein
MTGFRPDIVSAEGILAGRTLLGVAVPELDSESADARISNKKATNGQ